MAEEDKIMVRTYYGRDIASLNEVELRAALIDAMRELERLKAHQQFGTYWKPAECEDWPEEIGE